MAEPLYLQISGRLRQGILTGEYKPEDMLPSENELAARYSTSRVTVRKSLGVLESEGLVRPWHGKGYFVQPPKYTMFTLYFGDDATDGRFRFQEVTILRPEKDVAEKLLLKKHQMAIVTRRILERDDRVVAYDEKFVPYERGVPSIEFELHFTEFPHMFEERFAPMSLHTEMTIGMETAPEHVCAALSLAADKPLLVVGRLIRASDDKPVGFAKQYLTEAFGKLSARSGYYTQEKL
ncbi:GntR family transcriptional regulator [Sporobacter termitidis DSM 10068]|uniref:GntR family transcriptional regulator n=1 Tax=Sporobacter termitidis DSM 10068 TaxID=1123282 RepID=A0A1M5Z2K9_9FIRM|nr:GntR family transcriptional regulator [Sporobacter termitidis]SHI18348.1 GntR family transcriptional regulator [Sporobacter termitidis DSM 10068]